MAVLSNVWIAMSMACVFFAHGVKSSPPLPHNPPLETTTSTHYSKYSTCTKAWSTTRRLGGCSEQCASFDLSASAECSALRTQHCFMKPCDASMPEKLSCTFDDTTLNNLIVCPDDRIILDKVKLSSLNSVKYEMKLNVPDQRPANDVYFLFDRTVSDKMLHKFRMKAFNVLSKLQEMETTRVGVGAFSDEIYGIWAWKNRVGITSDFDSARLSIEKLSNKHGGDKNDANIYGLYQSTVNDTVGWRDGSRKMVIMFTNSVGHEPTCINGELKNRGSLIAKMNEKEITLMTVTPSLERLNESPTPFKCTPEDHDFKPRKGQLAYIASRTGGSVIKMSDFSFSTIAPYMRRRNVALSVDASDCGSIINSSHGPMPLPADIRTPSVVTLTNTFNVSPLVCDEGKEFQCAVHYKLNGISVTSVKINVKDAIGCPDTW